MRKYVHARPGSATRRAGVFVGVVIGHALVIWAFVNALITRAVPVNTAPMEVTLIPERHRSAAPPPLPPLRMRTLPPANVLTPVINIDVPLDAPPLHSVDAGIALTTSPATHLVNTPLIFVSGPQNSATYYPIVSEERGEQGSVLTKVCIDVTSGSSCHCTSLGVEDRNDRRQANSRLRQSVGSV
jgi:hypothetical protein